MAPSVAPTIPAVPRGPSLRAPMPASRARLPLAAAVEAPPVKGVATNAAAVGINPPTISPASEA